MTSSFVGFSLISIGMPSQFRNTCFWLDYNLPLIAFRCIMVFHCSKFSEATLNLKMANLECDIIRFPEFTIILSTVND